MCVFVCVKFSLELTIVVKIEDVTNQVQFAQLSRGYNREAIKNLPKIDESWTGKTATVLMAVTLNGGKAENAAALELKQEAQ